MSKVKKWVSNGPYLYYQTTTSFYRLRNDPNFKLKTQRKSKYNNWMIKQEV